MTRVCAEVAENTRNAAEKQTDRNGLLQTLAPQAYQGYMKQYGKEEHSWQSDRAIWASPIIREDFHEPH
jgi:hypothetical protein